MNQVGAGTLLAGKYRLESLIGRGGMGSVWRAEHLGLNAPVAVKLLDYLFLTGSADALSRFHREARAAATIRSPHVVQTFDHGIDQALGIPFIVMELMDGESLGSRLKRVGRLAPAEVARIITHVARALSRAHEASIVHRDLKPDNIFLVRNEDEEIAKVLDFGIAKAEMQGTGGSATITGAVMGTASYMSPEQISGAKVDFRSDLWALGVIACECLTGKRPFEADSVGRMALKICIEPIPMPSSFAPIPAGFDEWFSRLVNRDPAARFASARDAADALRHVCTGAAIAARSSEPILAPPAPDAIGQQDVQRTFTAPPVSRTANLSRRPPSKRRRLLPLAAGVLAVMALAIALSRRQSVTPAKQQQAAASSSAQVAATTTPALAKAADVCEPNARSCEGTTPRSCVGGQWTTLPVSAGECGAECTPESSPPRCGTSGIPESCEPTGTWRANAACKNYQECRAGECVLKKPAPGAPPPRAPAAAPKPDCDPSYTLDSRGQKHFKPECFR